jgi:chromosome segregation ATPase
MPMDSVDLKVVREILAAVRSGDEVTQKLLRRLGDQLEKSADTDREIARAFNRTADALDRMTAEIHALREDLTPALEKPKKLTAQKTPRPAANGGGA